MAYLDLWLKVSSQHILGTLVALRWHTVGLFASFLLLMCYQDATYIHHRPSTYSRVGLRGLSCTRFSWHLHIEFLTRLTIALVISDEICFTFQILIDSLPIHLTISGCTLYEILFNSPIQDNKDRSDKVQSRLVLNPFSSTGILLIYRNRMS